MNDVKFLYYGIPHLYRKAYTVVEMLIVVRQLKCEVFFDDQIL